MQRGGGNRNDEPAPTVGRVTQLGTRSRRRERISNGSTRRRTAGRTRPLPPSGSYARRVGIWQATKRAAGVRSAARGRAPCSQPRTPAPASAPAPATPRPSRLRLSTRPLLLPLSAARPTSGPDRRGAKAPSGQGHKAARGWGRARSCQIDRPSSSRHLMVVSPHLTERRAPVPPSAPRLLFAAACLLLVTATATATATGFNFRF